MQLIEEDERKRIMFFFGISEFFDGIKQQIIPFNAEFWGSNFLFIGLDVI